MAARQGIKKLSAGIERALTAHEFARGYVFISLDRDLNDILNVDDFTATVDGVDFPGRRISSSGRVAIPRSFLNGRPRLKRTVRIELRSRQHLVISAA